ncbi:SDR family oxidoreductase [Cryomorpha ignava]|uniref:SDR family oxidoreductase n=1 Tax=Cryomorpha ignava TaxID=101383 RepID=A0A7K3WKD7_9FLAO|nr:SDR family oxidoreductase [Cryomorpha ignava]NEN22099.1 SDR family oxidoreductase [Cryomorpha ignava]
MNISLKGKVALVSGSTQGIGKATAEELAKMGAKVILLARNEEKLKSAVNDLKAIADAGHDYIVADFSNPEEVKSAVEKMLVRHPQINILVNNTGGPPAGKAIDAGVDEFKKAFDMHLICNHIITSLLVDGMKKSGYGRIINVISTSVKQPLPNLGVSNTIRGAVANWSKTLSMELGPFGITVNNVLPGATATARLDSIAEKKSSETGKSVDEVLSDMGNAAPLQRVGQPTEVANGICFLASPAASYISGINLPVDGGRTKSL